MFSSLAVCRRAGITYRQLDYWCRAGVIEPTIDARGSGTQRAFSAAEVEHICQLAAYLRLGLTLEAARAAAEDPWRFVEQAMDLADRVTPDDVAPLVSVA